MAAYTPARLTGPSQPGTTDTTLYTVPAATQVIVKEIIVTNTTGTAATLSISIGATASGAYLMYLYSVPANATVVFALSTVLAAAETLHALQGTANALIVTVSGVTVV